MSKKKSLPASLKGVKFFREKYSIIAPPIDIDQTGERVK